MTGSVDLLLLNASNYPGQPIFPYAFVQVSALARTCGLKVARHDFLGQPRAEWPSIVANLIAVHQPRMIGFHLRQADSLFLEDYKPIGGVPLGENRYFPVEDTRLLIDQVRQISDVPVVVGGFGFTTHSTKLFNFLQPDYAVAGGPDGFFKAFDALASRDSTAIQDVANLMWRDETGIQRGPQVYFPPLPHPEYDDAIFTDLCAFYTRFKRTLSLGQIGQVDVPVEIMRGCPCRCYFCTEPDVKGRMVQRRDLDAVMADVDFLASRDIRTFWFICSELNMGGMEFPLQLAARMEQFNANRGARRVLWKAYAMPRPGMSRDQIRYLMSTGYIPAWNEVISFDDANLAECKMPYRAAQAVAYFNDVFELSRDPVYHGRRPSPNFDLFLGNAFMTASAMRTTLAVVEREGYAKWFRKGSAVMATRVFESQGRLNCGDADNVLSIGPDGPLKAIDVVHPTFYWAPELLAQLGTRERVEEFLAFVSRTLTTSSYAVKNDVLGFMASEISAARLAEHLAAHAKMALPFTKGIRMARAKAKMRASDRTVKARADKLLDALWTDPTEARVRALYSPVTDLGAVRAECVKTFMTVLHALNAGRLEPIYQHLGLGDADAFATPYRIMRKLYSRFESDADLIDSVRSTFTLDDESLPLLLTKYMLFTNGVRIDPAYRPLLFEQDEAPSTSSQGTISHSASS